MSNQQLPDEDDIPLPEALVADVLESADDVADHIEDLFDVDPEAIAEGRDTLEDEIHELEEDGQACESVAAVDGSYNAIDGTSIAAGLCTAVRAGADLDHASTVFPTLPSQDMATAMQGLTTMLEMQLVHGANSDVVIYDGSFIAALTRTNQLLEAFSQDPSKPIWKTVLPMIEDLFTEDHFVNALTDSPVVASPKRSTSSHVLESHSDLEQYADRFTDVSYFSRILEPGEYYAAVRQETGTNYGADYEIVDEQTATRIEDAFDNTGFAVYLYRPASFAGAYRIEIPKTTVMPDHEEILRAFGKEIPDPAMIEPYPQWLADKMAKKGSGLTDALLDKIQTQLGQAGYSATDINALLQGYRTETR